MGGSHDGGLWIETMKKIKTICGFVEGACAVGGGVWEQAARLRDPGRQGTGG